MSNFLWGKTMKVLENSCTAEGFRRLLTAPGPLSLGDADPNSRQMRDMRIATAREAFAEKSITRSELDAVIANDGEVSVGKK